jgi:hypothetical protein
MNRDQLIAAIRGASSPKPAPVPVPGIGDAFVRIMTAYDAAQTKKTLEAMKADDGCETGRLLACLLTDESGELLFDVKNAEDVLMLAKLPPAAQHAVLNASNQANAPGKG